ncbi:polyprotein [Fusarium oxysporum f. sp. phaseoli]
MTTDALKKKNRRQRLNPRGWIGYLVGYNSTNIYRVWNPLTNKVISTRDVIFNEKETFSGDVQHLKDDLKELNEEELIQHLTDAEVPQGSSINLDASTQEEDEELSALPEGLAFEREAASYPHRGFERDPTITQGETGRTLVVGDRNREEPDGTDHPYTTARFTPYLTPETCPLRPAALLVATIREPPVRKEGKTPLSYELPRWCMSHLALALPRDETAQMEPLVSFQLRAVTGRPHLMPVDLHL